MAEKKIQHYVPQMYFRNFSENGKSIGGFVLSNRKFVRDMPINGVCKRNYLYGDDLVIEKWFSSLETQWAKVIKKIIRQGNLDLADEEWTLLIKFIYLSDVRTGFIADTLDDYTSKLFQTMIMAKRDHGDVSFSDEQIKRMRMGMTIPNAAALNIMDKGLWLLADLVPALICNNTSRPFITSDNPVVKYNYLFAMKNYHCNYGYGQVGLIIFIPLSPKYCLLVYDPGAYKIAYTNDTITINSPNYIIELNRLFAKNAKAALYFKNSAREWVIKKYADGINDTSGIFNNHILKNTTGEYMVQLSSLCIFDKYKIGFIKIQPGLLQMDFPNNFAGPIRPSIQELQREENKDRLSQPYLSDRFFHYLHHFD